MEELQKEAEEYARRNDTQSGYEGKSLSSDDYKEIDAFIAGAKSKYVRVEKLQFAIDALSVLSLTSSNANYLKNKFLEQLKQLTK